MQRHFCSFLSLDCVFFFRDWLRQQLIHFILPQDQRYMVIVFGLTSELLGCLYCTFCAGLPDADFTFLGSLQHLVPLFQIDVLPKQAVQ